MDKPVSTRTQATLDYVTTGFALLFPRVLRARRSVRWAVSCVAMTKLSYALMTRQELSPVKAVPMKAHLGMDAIGGMGLITIPFVFRERSRLVTACCVGMGLFDILIAPFVDTTPSFDKAGRPHSYDHDRLVADARGKTAGVTMAT